MVIVVSLEKYSTYLITKLFANSFTQRLKCLRILKTFPPFLTQISPNWSFVTSFMKHLLRHQRMRVFPRTQFDIFIYVFHLIHFKENPKCDMEVNCLFQPFLIFNNYGDKICTSNLLFEAQFSSLWYDDGWLPHHLVRMKGNSTCENAWKSLEQLLEGSLARPPDMCQETWDAWVWQLILPLRVWI